MEALDLKRMTALGQALSNINEDKLVQPLSLRSGRFSATLTAQAVWEDRDFKRRGPPPTKEHPRPEIVEMGYETGVRLNYEFNKNWSVSAGLTKRNERATLNIREEIDYDKNDENDENINNKSYESASSYGEVGVNVALQRNPLFEPPNDAFSLLLTLRGEPGKGKFKYSSFGSISKKYR